MRLTSVKPGERRRDGAQDVATGFGGAAVALSAYCSAALALLRTSPAGRTLPSQAIYFHREQGGKTLIEFYSQRTPS